MIFTVNERLDADVIVVGAGPAGAATATHLARGGLDTVVVERATFPRDKACGDFLSPTALWELRALSPALTLAHANAITTAALHLDGSLLVEQELPASADLPPLGRVVPRRALDAAIADVARDAGARFLEGSSVAALERRGRTIAVEVTGRPRRLLRARAVVGADGSNSFVGRVLRHGRVPRGDRIIALRGYYDDVSGPPNRAELFFSRDSFPGYCWVFPTGTGTANVGVGMLLETYPSHETHLRDVLSRVCATDPALRRTLARALPTSKLVGWPLTTYNPRLPLAADGLLLVGDAAGLINPINGEGIQYALASARWAAKTLLASAEEGFDRTRLAAYERRVADELRLDMALARVISRLIANRMLNPFWLLALRAITSRAVIDSGYAARAGGVLVGLRPTHDAARPDFAMATVEATATALVRAVVARVLREDRAEIPLELATAVGSGIRAPEDLLLWASSSAAEMKEFARAIVTTAQG